MHSASRGRWLTYAQRAGPKGWGRAAVPGHLPPTPPTKYSRSMVATAKLGSSGVEFWALHKEGSRAELKENIKRRRESSFLRNGRDRVPGKIIHDTRRRIVSLHASNEGSCSLMVTRRVLVEYNGRGSSRERYAIGLMASNAVWQCALQNGHVVPLLPPPWRTGISGRAVRIH